LRRFEFSARTLALLLLLAAAPVAVLIASPGSAQAQSAQRSVEGKVTNAQDQLMANAIVFLKDTHSLAIKSVATTKDGVFHFMQLSSANDYEVWAELGNKKSNVKTISSFDTRKNFVLALKFK
jgi:hypothetical protein